MGKPALVNPQGMEIVGIPQTLKGRVFLSINNSCGRSLSGFARRSAIDGGGIGTVGVNSTSTSLNVSWMA
jgi:hypothetical protein